MNFSHDFLAIFNLLHRRNRNSIYAISISIFVFDQDVQTKQYIINEFSNSIFFLEKKTSTIIKFFI